MRNTLLFCCLFVLPNISSAENPTTCDGDLFEHARTDSSFEFARLKKVDRDWVRPSRSAVSCSTTDDELIVRIYMRPTSAAWENDAEFAKTVDRCSMTYVYIETVFHHNPVVEIKKLNCR